MQRRNYKISYIKKSYAKKSLVAIALCVAAVLLCFFGLRLGVVSQGQAGLNAGAFGFSSLLMSLFSLGYAVSSFGEKEKNYLLSKISILIGVLLVLFWVALIIV